MGKVTEASWKIFIIARGKTESQYRTDTWRNPDNSQILALKISTDFYRFSDSELLKGHSTKSKQRKSDNHGFDP